jgi:hypothetical protein
MPLFFASFRFLEAKTNYQNKKRECDKMGRKKNGACERGRRIYKNLIVFAYLSLFFYSGILNPFLASLQRFYPSRSLSF